MNFRSQNRFDQNKIKDKIILFLVRYIYKQGKEKLEEL